MVRDAEWLTLFENLPLDLCEVNEAASTHLVVLVVLRLFSPFA